MGNRQAERPDCRHQWSNWNSNPGSETQTRWCHVCNSVEERPRAHRYQQFQDRITPGRVRDLPACRTPGCGAKAGQPCRDSNGVPVYIWRHGNRLAGRRS